MNAFNRAELYLTRSMPEQARITGILAQNGIEYQVICRSRDAAAFIPEGSGPGGQRSACGQDLAHYYQYRVYVRRKDLARARFLTGLAAGGPR